MAVLLVLATFFVFVAIDYVLTHKQKVAEPALQTPLVAPALLSSASIEGILIADQLRYHPGHTWLQEEANSKIARTGADALATSTIGPVSKLELPKIGRWIRQGQKAFTLYAGNEKIELVSPAEGEVVEINTAVLKDPALLMRDPYRNGWLVKVSMPERETVVRNLLPASLVRSWMKDEIRRVRQSIPAAVSKVAVIGGGAFKPAPGEAKKLGQLFL